MKMETLDSLKKTIGTSTSVKKVVSTMKVLAAANIKKYEKAADSAFRYRKNIELSLQAILKNAPETKIDSKYIAGDSGPKGSANVAMEGFSYEGASPPRPEETKAVDVVMVIGSNQGLCGRFNDRVVDFLLDDIKNTQNPSIITIGDRISLLVESKKLNLVKSISLPNTMDNIIDTIYELLNMFEDARSHINIGRVLLYYTRHEPGTNGDVVKDQIFPLSSDIFDEIRSRPWPTSKIPIWRVDTEILFADLTRQYLFILMYNALINSAASEQRNRLVTLQNAENNIEEIIETKRLEFNQRRQGVITSELLDVVTGYQASKKKK